MGKKATQKTNRASDSPPLDEGPSTSTAHKTQRGTNKRSKATEKDERRRDKALKKICEAARPSPAQASEQLSLDLHEVNIDNSQLWGNPAVASPPASATQPVIAPTPSPSGDPPVATSASPEVQEMIARAIQKGIAEGLIQLGRPTGHISPSPQVVQVPCRLSTGSSDEASADSSPEMSADEEQRELALSEDEGMPADPPSVSSLFQAALFRSLLFKASTLAALPSSSSTSSATPSTSSATNQPASVFTEPAAKQDVIPTPLIFQEAVRKQWSNPGAGAQPSSSDKKFFNIEQVLADDLLPPTIDAPIAAIYTTTAMPGDSAELLKPEDRRTEQALIKTHQAAAWAVKASTTASFFSRASLLWLQQLQSKIPTADVRAHQDINKLVAAAQFIADATLQSARFASRAIGSNVVARRMHWLRSWQADTRHKWRLALTPFKGPTLFGASLDPILIESKDKKKIMPTVSRRATFRPTPYHRKPFRLPDPAPSYTKPQGQYANTYTNTYRQRQGQDRQGKGKPYKRPFRGGGGRSYRRPR